MVLATNEFREFLNFYPTHERAHYAQFQLAMTHFKQMRAPMRDQTETRDAIRELQAYVTRFPDKPLIGEARAKLREAKDRIGDWDAGVAQHYFRIKWYPGVGGASRAVAERRSRIHPPRRGVLFLGESLVQNQAAGGSAPYFERLVKEFEQSEYLEKAKLRITELKALPAAVPGKGNQP
jgi:outer membrane protein assembly factor BamD (BamD/ComL family)